MDGAKICLIIFHSMMMPIVSRFQSYADIESAISISLVNQNTHKISYHCITISGSSGSMLVTRPQDMIFKYS